MNILSKYKTVILTCKGSLRMAAWIIQETRENTTVKILKHKKFFRVPIFIKATEYVVCSSYGNGHCPSNYIVSCCDVVSKVF